MKQKKAKITQNDEGLFVVSIKIKFLWIFSLWTYATFYIDGINYIMEFPTKQDAINYIKYKNYEFIN